MRNRNAHGAKHIVIDPARLSYFLNIRKYDMTVLRIAALIQTESQVKIPKIKIDYSAPANEYRRQLQSRKFCK